MNAPTVTVGDLLRDWRRRRRMSQLELALEAEISAKHLSFVESGRSRPSREMLLHLCEMLAVPLRERNAVLLAAGYAPVFPKRSMDDPALKAAFAAIGRVLTGHEPYPALAVDRHWHLLAANRAVPLLLAGAAPELLAPPVNVLRLSLHPDGLAPRIANLAEWRGHLLARLRQQIEASADAALSELHRELSAYPAPASKAAPHGDSIAVPLRFQSEAGMLSLLSTTTVFGTPVDVTLSELAIEAFFPADAETAARLQTLLAASPASSA
jgi:transcriptional regulator with XRE-family HTH domain